MTLAESTAARKRSAASTSSVMTFERAGVTFNLLDTPGHEDFSEDTYRTLTAVDSAVMVIDAAKGIEVQTRKLFEVCRMRDVPIVTFIYGKEYWTSPEMLAGPADFLINWVLPAVAVLLFGPAGDVHYWQAWVFLGVFAVSAWIPSIYLQVTNPAALQRRMRGGPVAEGRTVQKVAMAGLYLSLAAMCVTSALDHRFGWSSMPAAASATGFPKSTHSSTTISA